MFDEDLVQAADLLRKQLVHRNQRIVLAESCTAGNVAGSLAVLPGISQWLCGSFVIYRNESKANWLGIDRALLDDPNIGPVSELVTKQLALATLERTPEASLGLAVTGHVGPGVTPHELDGRAFCALCDRTGSLRVAQLQIQSPEPINAQDIPRRAARLKETTLWVLTTAAEWLKQI